MFILAYRFKRPRSVAFGSWSQEILVVGCGNSNLPSDLAQQGFSVVAMDYSKCLGEKWWKDGTSEHPPETPPLADDFPWKPSISPEKKGWAFLAMFDWQRVRELVLDR